LQSKERNRQKKLLNTDKLAKRKSISKLIFRNEKPSLSMPAVPSTKPFVPKDIEVENKTFTPTMKDLANTQKGLRKDATIYVLGGRKKSKKKK